ncbi:MAG: class I SAM-dependent methyltransferase [Actinomycetota bacterium]
MKGIVGRTVAAARAVGVRVLAKDAARAARWITMPGKRRRPQLAQIHSAKTSGEIFEAAWEFAPQQVEQEIVSFLDLVNAEQPRLIVEIGSASGGTTFMLSRVTPPDATIISVDLYVRNKFQLRRSAQPSQRLTLIDGSSRDPETLRAIEDILAGRLLDLLFIDGDHSYEGVASDFRLYRHLVREGGLVAFHDIQPDGWDRGPSPAWSGGVPDFWRAVRDSYERQELIGSPEQLGYGIGVIRYTSKAVLPAELG